MLWWKTTEQVFYASALRRRRHYVFGLSVRPKPEIPSFDLCMGPLVHPTNRDRFTACPSVRADVSWPSSELIITRDSEVIMFSPCVFVCLFVCLCVCVCGCLCLSRCLSEWFNYEGLVPHKQYFAGALLGMSSCAIYVSCPHDVIDDVTRSQSRSNFEIDISPSIFELQRRSKAQNVGNAHGYLSGIFNFRYNFR